MIVTVYKSLRDTTPQPQEMTWEQFIHQPEMATHALTYPTKDSVPLISPAEIRKGMTRLDKNVIGLWFGLFDIDKVPPEVMVAVHDNLVALGIAHRIYTTWSHGKNYREKGLSSFRVALPYTRMLLAAEAPKAWPLIVQKLLLGYVDKSTNDLSRMFFLPSAPAGTDPEDLINFYVEGRPFDLDSLQMEASPIVQMPEQRLTVVEIQAKIKAFGKKEKYAEFVDLLKKMLAGEAIATTTGERHAAIRDLTWRMVTTWPDKSAESIVEHLMPSLQFMALEDPTPRDWEGEALRLVASAQQKKEEARISDENEAAAEKRKQISNAIPGRTTPYTAEELAEWGIDQYRWIIQYRSWYYFFINGSYDPRDVSKDEFFNFARDALAPASSANVELTKRTKDGFVPKTPNEISADYASVAKNLVRSLIAQRSEYDGTTLTLAVCPRLPIEPKFSPEVDAWLKVFAGAKYEKMLDWLACLPRQEEACAALFVKGAEGAGKNLLARGAARIWTHSGPVTLGVALGERSDFNSAMARCPLIFGDERMPTNFRGQPKTEDLRALISEGHHQFKRKNQDESTLQGYVRVILAANNEEMLKTAQALTNEDIAAISKRILTVDVGEDARIYVESLTFEQRDALEKAIAPHALYLAQTRKVVRGKRFIVDGDESAALSMIVSAGLRGPVLHWCVAYTLSSRAGNNALIQKGMQGLICVRDGKLHITAPALGEVWDAYKTNRPAPEMHYLSQALRGVSEKKRLKLRVKTASGVDRRVEFWVIETANMIRWAEDQGFGNAEAIREALARGDRADEAEQAAGVEAKRLIAEALEKKGGK